MTWSYYPDGKIRSKADDGVPVGSAVVLVDNSDSQNTSTTGTWATGDVTGQHGYDHRTHAAGTGTDAFAWKLNIPKDGTYTAYVKYPKVTGATTSAKYTVKHATGTVDVTRDQTAAAETWVSLGSYTFTQGNAAEPRSPAAGRPAWSPAPSVAGQRQGEYDIYDVEVVLNPAGSLRDAYPYNPIDFGN